MRIMQSLHPQDSETPFFQSDALEAYAGDKVFHGFFGRQGGVSTDIYASLNCGTGSDDDPGKVKQNRKIVSEIVGCAPERLLGVHQVHGNHCVRASEPWTPEGKPKADGLVTNVPGIALSVLTADCAPVLFHGQDKDGGAIIGAAHAGWGGALKGVLGSTIEQMNVLGAEIESIKAVIGPCIGQKSYEVEEAFSDAFLKEDEDNERFFKTAQREEHLMFDLPGYCAAKLAKSGVKDVSIKDIDTYFNEEDFFSYRRTTHRRERDYGRQISVIMIRGEGENP